MLPSIQFFADDKLNMNITTSFSGNVSSTSNIEAKQNDTNNTSDKEISKSDNPQDTSSNLGDYSPSANTPLNSQNTDNNPVPSNDTNDGSPNPSNFYPDSPNRNESNSPNSDSNPNNDDTKDSKKNESKPSGNTNISDDNNNADKSKKPDKNNDTDKSKKPDKNNDTDKSKKPDDNNDTDNNKKPDDNNDTDKSKKPDDNNDADNNKKPDDNNDADNNKKPDDNNDADKSKKLNGNDANNDRKPSNMSNSKNNDGGKFKKFSPDSGKKPSLENTPTAKAAGKDNPLGKVQQAKNIADQLKNAENSEDKAAAIGDAALKAGTEIAKKAPSATVQAIGRGVEIADKIGGQTEVGKAVKKGIGYCCFCSCCSAAILPLLPILFITVFMTSIWGWIFGLGPDGEVGPNPMENVYTYMQGELVTLNKNNGVTTGIVVHQADYISIIDNILTENNSHYSEEFKTAVQAMTSNYTVEFLTREDPNSNLDKQNISLINDVLNLGDDLENYSARGNPQSGLPLFFGEYVKKAYWEDLANFLEEEITFYNPNSLEIETSKLYDMFKIKPDGSNYSSFDVSAILHYSGNNCSKTACICETCKASGCACDNCDCPICNANKDFKEKYNEFTMYLTKIEIMTYMRVYSDFYQTQRSIREIMARRNVYQDNIDKYFSGFFDDFIVMKDIPTFMALSSLTGEPGFSYEVARTSCESMEYWDDEMPETVTYRGADYAYLEQIETWYGAYTFEAETIGDESVQVFYTGFMPSERKLFEKYNLVPEETYLSLFEESLGLTLTNSSFQYSKLSELSGASTDSRSMVFNFMLPIISEPEDPLVNGSNPNPGSRLNITNGYHELYSSSTVEQLGLSNNYHQGVDFAVPVGTPIVATGSGVVTSKIRSNSGYGNYITITHENGYKSIYAHGNGTFYVEEGETVKAGQKIMQSGNSGASTGPHLHFEIRNSEAVPIDPFLFIKQNA